MAFWIGAALDAVTAVAILVLVSLGLYIAYGLLRVINMAHGEMMTLGAYVAAALSSSGVGFLWAILSATLAIACFGAAIERLVIRPLHDRNDLSTLLATWGVSLVIVEAIRLLVGPSGVFVDTPYRVVLRVGTTPYPAYSLLLVFVSVSLLLAVAYVVNRTAIGLVVRATIENPTLAAMRRTNVDRVYRWGFTVSAALAGLAGAFVAPISAVTPTMGIEYVPLAFLVVIVGGGAEDAFSADPASGTSPAGAVPHRSILLPLIGGAVIVAGSRSLLNSLIGITPATIGMFALVLLILLVRPRGLLVRR